MATKEEEISSQLNSARASNLGGLVHEDNLRTLIEEFLMQEDEEEDKERLEFESEEGEGSGERGRSRPEAEVGVGVKEAEIGEGSRQEEDDCRFRCNFRD